MREREGKQRAEIFGTAVRKAHLHAVASEVDPERRLGKLRGYLLRGELHFPGPVGVAIQAQVLLVGIGLRVEILDVCVRESVGGGYARKRRQRAPAGREGRVEKPFRGKEPRATGRAARAAAMPTRRRFAKSRETAGFPQPGNGRYGDFDVGRDAGAGAGRLPVVSALIRPSRRFWKLSATSSTVRGASIAGGGGFSKAAPRPDPARETRARWRSMRGRRTSRGTGRATSVRVTFPARQTRLGTCAPRQCAETSTRGFLQSDSGKAKAKHFGKMAPQAARRSGAKLRIDRPDEVGECRLWRVKTDHAPKRMLSRILKKKTNNLHLVRDERVVSELAPAYHEEVHARRRPPPGV